MRYALVKNNVVIYIVVWDGVSPYRPDGILVPIKDLPVNEGDLYDGRDFSPPEVQDE